MFAKWSNSFQVFEDERFEFGMFPKNSLNHLMVVEGWFTGKAPPPGHYSTEALKQNGKYVVEQNPFFDEPFIIDPNLESKELTKFSIRADIWKNAGGNNWSCISGESPLKLIHIIPIDEHATTFIDHLGHEMLHSGPYLDSHGTEHYKQASLYHSSFPPPAFTITPQATVNVGKPFMLRTSFLKAMPPVDYNVTVFENHIMDFESTEHGFNIYLRGWMDENHIDMKPFRSTEDDWLVGGAKRYIERYEEVYDLVEKIKIKD